MLLQHQESPTTEHLYHWNCSAVGHGTLTVLDIKSVNITIFAIKSPSSHLMCLPNCITICGKKSIFETSSVSTLQTEESKSFTLISSCTFASHSKKPVRDVTNSYKKCFCGNTTLKALGKFIYVNKCKEMHAETGENLTGNTIAAEIPPGSHH